MSMLTRPLPWLYSAVLTASLGSAPLTTSSCSGDPDDTPTPACDEPVDVQAQLDNAVDRNAGYGGGIYVIDGPCGSRFSGVSGRVFHNSPDAMSPAVTFEVASVTKTFTATVVLLLVEDGLLDLDDPIGPLLPSDLLTGLLVVGGHDYSLEITLRQLLNHTSGLPDYWSDPPFVRPGVNAFLADWMADVDRFWPPEEILPYVRDLDPVGRPGAAYHYSDTNYVLLGLLIEALTGEALHDVFSARLFEPLGMLDTYLSYHEAPVSDELESHRYEDDWDLYGKTHQSADWAGGGLVSSTRDLSRFMQGLAEGEVFAAPEMLEAMRTSVPTGSTDVSYGLGIFRVTLDDGGELWGHDGYGNAFMYYSEGDGHVHVGTLNQTSNDWWPMVYAGVTAVRHP